MTPPALATLGWRTERPHVIVDCTGDDTIRIARVWSPAASYRSRTSSSRFRVIHSALGSATITRDGSTTELATGQWALLSTGPDTALEVTSTQPWAHYEFQFAPNEIGPDAFGADRHAPVEIPAMYSTALTSLANSILNSGQGIRHRSSAHVKASVEHLLLASQALPGADDVRDESGNGAPLIYQQASRLIELHHRDPNFSVATLQQLLRVSTRTLHRAFATMGTTPRITIETCRVREAERLLSMPGNLAPSGDMDIPARSGFTSRRQMLHALHRARARRAEDGGRSASPRSLQEVR